MNKKSKYIYQVHKVINNNFYDIQLYARNIIGQKINILYTITKKCIKNLLNFINTIAQSEILNRSGCKTSVI